MAGRYAGRWQPDNICKHPNIDIELSQSFLAKWFTLSSQEAKTSMLKSNTEWTKFSRGKKNRIQISDNLEGTINKQYERYKTNVSPFVRMRCVCVWWKPNNSKWILINIKMQESEKKQNPRFDECHARHTSATWNKRRVSIHLWSFRCGISCFIDSPVQCVERCNHMNVIRMRRERSLLLCCRCCESTTISDEDKKFQKTLSNH